MGHASQEQANHLYKRKWNGKHATTQQKRSNYQRLQSLISYRTITKVKTDVQQLGLTVMSYQTTFLLSTCISREKSAIQPSLTLCWPHLPPCPLPRYDDTKLKDMSSGRRACSNCLTGEIYTTVSTWESSKVFFRAGCDKLLQISYSQK